MKLGRIGLPLLLKSGVLVLLMTGTALAFTGGEYLPQAKMAPAQARQIALKAYPGKIVSEELEEEPDGSGLRYSFVISNQNAKHELGADCSCGSQTIESFSAGVHPPRHSKTLYLRAALQARFLQTPRIVPFRTHC